MKIITAEYAGFCFGVKNAVDIALEKARGGTYTYGELIHNEIVTGELFSRGVKCIDNAEEVKSGTVILRSHGITKNEYEILKQNDVEIIDATCPFVKKIQNLAAEYSAKGYHIVVIGKAEHPEVKGIVSYAESGCTVIDENYPLEELRRYEKLCFVAQTTFDTEKYADIIKKIEKHRFKTVEIFDTICYTTYKRQKEAAKISSVCNVMLVLGSKKSSNTVKLYEICKKNCSNSYLIEAADALKNINFKTTDTVGIVAGASTPNGLITEVKEYMGQQFEEVQSKEFIDGVEESFVSYREGRRVKGTVIYADDSGIKVNIGGKKDGYIPKAEVLAEGEYNAADFPADTEIEAVITNKQDAETGCVLMSKKKVDLIKEGDKIVETIRGGEVFEFKADKETKGGLLGKLGTYTVFIPASQIREGFVKELKNYVDKTLRLTALEIDDNRHKIVASQRKVLETERKEREEIFWTNVQPDVIVSGKVKRITPFGAFVSVDGFDCLAHIVDLSWTHIKTADEVLKIGETYDFLVLSVDREKGRVSLSYKALQPHPFDKCIENHPIGSVCKGKVTSIVPFGAFVEIEPGIEGLVHVSEAAHTFVKNISEVVKVGDEVDVMILNADPANKKITLSIKATLPEDAAAETEAKSDKKSAGEGKDSKKAKAKEEKEETEWNDENSNTPFADLLKNLDV